MGFINEISGGFTMNETEELSINIRHCPYCGSEDIESDNQVDICCNECGRDFKVMTHE